MNTKVLHPYYNLQEDSDGSKWEKEKKCYVNFSISLDNLKDVLDLKLLFTIKD